MLYTGGQILREYLAVATRPVDQNGLGMARLDAVEPAAPRGEAESPAVDDFASFSDHVQIADLRS